MRLLPLVVFLLVLLLESHKVGAGAVFRYNRRRLCPTKSVLWAPGGGQEVEQSGSSIPSHFSIIGRIRALVPFNRMFPSAQSAEKTPRPYNPLRMYMSCLGIVIVWIVTGTLFYSYCNDWPLPQSFFYAVDAGMSIGFCTQVAETKLISKAFTVLYILLGASVIGGALALFIQDAVEGLSTPAIEEYQVLLERTVFDHADLDRTGELTLDQFRGLIRSSVKDQSISEEDIQRLWQRFDRLQNGVIHFEEFAGSFRGIERIVQAIKTQQPQNPIQWAFSNLRLFWKTIWHLEHRIYTVFCLWIALGVTWGMIDQGWDLITATHFAVSALATGGLTAPQVNAEGILPAEPSIFCGMYCLFGIPLFALTLGHFAKVLVSGHVAALERTALTRPMTPAEYELASHLTTNDSVVHLSDFIVLQLLRQGKLSSEAIQVMKRNFEMLDVDGNGTLSMEQTTSSHYPVHEYSSNTAEPTTPIAPGHEKTD
jgi:Ca2+-binding EF-hand superfamily protein